MPSKANTIAIANPAINAGNPFSSYAKNMNFKFSIAEICTIPFNAPIIPAIILTPDEKKNDNARIARVGIIDTQAIDATE